MNKKEIVKILALYKIAFPRTYNNLSPSDEDVLLNLWYAQFKSYDYKLVADALNYWLAADTTGYAPTIGQLKNTIYNAANPSLTEGEAWAVVRKAMQDGGFTKAEWETLPEDIKTVCVSPQTVWQWAQMDSAEVNGVIASNFSRSYRALLEKKRKEEIAGNISQEIASIYHSKPKELLENQETLAIEYEESEEHEHIYDPERDMYVIRKKEKPVKEMASDLANALSMPSENQKER